MYKLLESIYRGLCLGILVIGAEKAEEKIGYLKMTIRTITNKGRNTIDARIRQTLQGIQKQLGRESQMPLRKSELPGRRLLKRIIETAIQELEKLDRRLGQDNKIPRYAA